MRYALALALCLVTATTLHAEPRPSFRLDSASWYATHVIVATEGESIDGTLTVLESWKGDVRAGETVTIPELAAFRTEESRGVSKGWRQDGEPPLFVTGKRMILFLTRKEGRWSGVFHDDLKTSVVWIERGAAYAFSQIINPGDSLLLAHDEEPSEPRIAARFAEIERTHRALDAALAREAADARATALASFADDELWFVREAAFAGLRTCGAAAVPVLTRMLHDDARLTVHDDAIAALAEIGLAGGGESVEGIGAELTRVVREETAFWRATAPRLSAGWWNDVEDPKTERLRERYSRVFAALNALQKVKSAGAAAAVTELRDLWRSLPQLVNRSGVDQLSEACNAVLRHQGEPASCH
jgi:hypothetical protein